MAEHMADPIFPGHGGFLRRKQGMESTSEVWKRSIETACCEPIDMILGEVASNAQDVDCNLESITEQGPGAMRLFI